MSERSKFGIFCICMPKLVGPAEGGMVMACSALRCLSLEGSPVLARQFQKGGKSGLLEGGRFGRRSEAS